MKPCVRLVLNVFDVSEYSVSQEQQNFFVKEIHAREGFRVCC